MNFIKRSLVVAGILTLGAMGASAATLVQTLSFGPSGTDWSVVLNFNQFNPSTGVLLGASIQLDGYLDSTVGLENKNPSGRTVRHQVQGDLDITAPNAILNVNFNTGLQTDVVSGFDGLIDYAGTSGRTHMYSQFGTASHTYAPIDLPLFIGTGTLPVQMDATALAAFSGGGNLATLVLTQATGIATLTYLYREVPEPATFLLIGSALFGVAMIRRQRSARQ